MINGRPVEAVLVDLDDTLVNTRTAMATSLVSAFESVGGQRLSDDEANRVVETWRADPGGWYRKYEAGELTVTEQRRRRYLDVMAEVGVGSLDAYAEWQENYVTGTVAATKLFDDTDGFLDAVAHLSLAVVTNVESTYQRQKIDAVGLGQRLRIVLGADLVARAKPDPALFELACGRLGVEPAACVHIGDSWEADVVGAQRAGIPAIWLDRDGADADRELPDGVWRVTKLTEIPDMLA